MHHLKRLTILMTAELWEQLNAKAWQRFYAMLPPDTVMRSCPNQSYGSDEVELRLYSLEFDEIPVGVEAPKYIFSIQRPANTPIEDAQFEIQERWNSNTPHWVRSSFLASPPPPPPPVSPASVRRMLNGRGAVPDLRMDNNAPYPNDLDELQKKLNGYPNRLAACTCDFAYTGLRYHKSGCPAK